MAGNIFQFLFSDGNSNDDESSNGETTKGLGVYAQNIDLHLHAADGASGETPGKIYNFNILEVLFSNIPCRFLNPNYVFQFEFYFFFLIPPGTS